jgi:hypothetical protein
MKSVVKFDRISISIDVTFVRKISHVPLFLLKTGIKMIDVSCMVHVYKIANEKVASMYYLNKQSRRMHSFIFPPCKTQ